MNKESEVVILESLRGKDLSKVSVSNSRTPNNYVIPNERNWGKIKIFIQKYEPKYNLQYGDLWKCTLDSNTYEFDGISWFPYFRVTFPWFKYLGSFDNSGNPLNQYNTNNEQ